MYHLVIRCQEGLKCVEPRQECSLADMGEGVRGAEGWTLLCPLCTICKREMSRTFDLGEWRWSYLCKSVSEENAKMWPITDLPQVQWLLFCLCLSFNKILVRVLPCLLWLKIKTKYTKSTSIKMLLCLNTDFFPIPHLHISPHPSNRKGHQRPWSDREVCSSMLPRQFIPA